MHQKLPQELDPFRYAQNGLELEGELQLLSMNRLAKYLHNDEGVVDITMKFDVDETGTPYMRGQFQVTLSLNCERCTQAMDLELKVDSLLAIVKSEIKVEGLAEQYEPWVIDTNDLVILSSVVEDELILALPLVPRHDHDCLPEEVWSAGDDLNVEEEKPASPFAVLSALKVKN
ncbi:MAG: DNA-binding protein [Methylophaga sp.]|nr:MAG: DNA-binding protein [Methylophaga sp.]